MPQIYDMGPTACTSPPKEGVFRIFSPLKIRRLRPGLNQEIILTKKKKMLLIHLSQQYELLRSGSMGPFCDPHKTASGSQLIRGGEVV